MPTSCASSSLTGVFSPNSPAHQMLLKSDYFSRLSKCSKIIVFQIIKIYEGIILRSSKCSKLIKMKLSQSPKLKLFSDCQKSQKVIILYQGYNKVREYLSWKMISLRRSTILPMRSFPTNILSVKHFMMLTYRWRHCLPHFFTFPKHILSGFRY